MKTVKKKKVGKKFQKHFGSHENSKKKVGKKLKKRFGSYENGQK